LLLLAALVAAVLLAVVEALAVLKLQQDFLLPQEHPIRLLLAPVALAVLATLLEQMDQIQYFLQ
jgi:hypothetical protein